jgi:hypothetical protein
MLRRPAVIYSSSIKYLCVVESAREEALVQGERRPLYKGCEYPINICHKSYLILGLVSGTLISIFSLKRAI